MDENITPEQPVNPQPPPAAQPHAAPEPGPEPADQTPAPPPIAKNVRDMAAICHLLGIVGFLGPLIIWLLRKEDHPFIYEQGKNAINFQLSILLYAVIMIILVITMWLLPLLFAANIILCVIAGTKASEGKSFKYPAAIRFLK